MLHLPSASGLLICISGSVSSALLNKGKVFCICSFVSALPSLSSQGISSAVPGWFAQRRLGQVWPGYGTRGAASGCGQQLPQSRAGR